MGTVTRQHFTSSTASRSPHPDRLRVPVPPSHRGLGATQHHACLLPSHAASVRASHSTVNHRDPWLVRCQCIPLCRLSCTRGRSSPRLQWLDEIGRCTLPGTLSVHVYYNSRIELTRTDLAQYDVVLTTCVELNGHRGHHVVDRALRRPRAREDQRGWTWGRTLDSDSRIASVLQVPRPGVRVSSDNQPAKSPVQVLQSEAPPPQSRLAQQVRYLTAIESSRGRCVKGEKMTHKSNPTWESQS